MAWVRLPGADRRYHNSDTGETLSRRQYDKMREFEGERSKFDKTRLAKQVVAQKKYNNRLKSYVQAERSKGREITKSQARTSAELKAINKDFKKLHKVVGTDKNGRPILFRDTPEGRTHLRDDLVKLGRRNGIPNWVPPGLSDRYRQGKLRPSRVPKKFSLN
jgi:hypothetical protein